MGKLPNLYEASIILVQKQTHHKKSNNGNWKTIFLADLDAYEQLRGPSSLWTGMIRYDQVGFISECKDGLTWENQLM